MSVTGLMAGKVVFVTGGANGIGRAIATLAARQGAKAVIVADFSPDPRDGERVEDAVRAAGAEFAFEAIDVTDAAAVERAVAGADRFGGIDMMAANAGVSLLNDHIDVDDEGYDRLVDVNFKGVFRSVRAAARPMIARGKGGSIVITSSMGGIRGAAMTLTYSATKAAARLYAQSFADTLGPHGIRVNAICPGIIDTGFAPIVPEVAAFFEGLRLRTPLRRSGAAEEVAGVAVWLGSDLASYVTGASIVVDGGLTAVL